METQFPGGSKGRINRAGDAVRRGLESEEDLAIIEEWRRAHRAVLNTFQAILRNRTRGTSITVAQRHKRKSTIFNKLRRYPSMSLSRMDDIAGCRLIFPNLVDLYAFREGFLRARFNHRCRNNLEKYDYIARPKSSGYRGIHDVFEYNVNSSSGRALTGLYVEVQYRTVVQHAWATAVEVVDNLMPAKIKFQQGGQDYLNAMTLASTMLARAFEEKPGYYTAPDDHTIALNFARLNTRLRLLWKLRRLKMVEATSSPGGDSILVFSGKGKLQQYHYSTSDAALRSLFQLELELPTDDIVYVKAASGHDVRLAFKNYYSDVLDFINLMEESCLKLTGQTLAQLSKPRYLRLYNGGLNTELDGMEE